MELVHRGVTLEAELGAKPRTLKFTISTGDLDRMGDTINPKGWDFAEWKADGSPILFGHRHDVPAIARGVEIAVVGDRVKSVAEFPPAGTYGLADDVFNLAKSGFLKSASVGFQAVEWTYNDSGGRNFLAQTLREWSIVNVPALGAAKLEAALGATAAVEKWLGRPAARGVSICPAGLDCPNVSQAELCPAGRLCPMSGPARTSWRDRGPVIEIDWGGEDEYVLVLDDSETRSVPANVSTSKAPESTPWSAPSLKDFTDKAWGDLSAAEKRNIAGHYAWCRTGTMPESFGDLALPHHQASDGKVVWNGVRAAMARANQVTGGNTEAIMAHLKAHAKAFGKSFAIAMTNHCDRCKRPILTAAVTDLPLCHQHGGSGVVLSDDFDLEIITFEAADLADALSEVVDEKVREVSNRLRGRVD